MFREEISFFVCAVKLRIPDTKIRYSKCKKLEQAAMYFSFRFVIFYLKIFSKKIIITKRGIKWYALGQVVTRCEHNSILKRIKIQAFYRNWIMVRIYSSLFFIRQIYRASKFLEYFLLFQKLYYYLIFLNFFKEK